jgi:hypothetical protein
VQWRSQLDSQFYNLAFAQVDDRGHDLDPGLWFGPHLYHTVERFIIFETAIGITRTIFRDRSDVDLRRADDFSPVRSDQEPVSVVEGQ